MLRRVFCGLVGLVGAWLTIRGADAWSDAQRLFSAGHFREAATLLERQAGANPRSPRIWFNLGQAHFQAGETGRALAAWERASALAPRDSQIRAALAMVRNRVQAPPEPAWTGALGLLTMEEWAALWLATAVVLATTWATGRARSAGIQWMRWLSGLANAGAGVLWLAALLAGRHRSNAVVVSRDAHLLESPVPQARVIRSLPEGSTFRTGRAFGDWYEVDQDGRPAGWVRKDGLKLFRDGS